jgi:hypothetical protein
MGHGFTSTVLDFLVTFGKELLLPFLTICFFSAIALRGLVYWTVKRELWFVKQFDLRMQRHFKQTDNKKVQSFSYTLKRLLEKTFYELFESRSVMRSSKLDNIMAPSDRLFLIQQGAAYLVRDTLKAAASLRKDDQKEEKDELIEVSQQVLSLNPSFSKLFGIFPVGPLNDFLNQLPGLFIVGGIFGTFLGIMKALPELQGMNPSDAEGTKLIMDAFLVKIAFSMSTSTLGILYSVTFTVFNSFVNPEKLFMEVVNRYERSLHHLWRRSETNEITSEHHTFDENRDPVEALAELALQKELAVADTKNKNKNDPEDYVTKEVEPPTKKAA